ncbi:hypothetical protein F2Q68_00011507 [Brassica cretica]|uniref:Uncharacterized protein n=1 Tax=Brassica cretica TaxID=69181 RepID=A0A8S9L350_BRACR|nr:hypothetical protein F2Q68_00011507 [Brassica cretica]
MNITSSLTAVAEYFYSGYRCPICAGFVGVHKVQMHQSPTCRLQGSLQLQHGCAAFPHMKQLTLLMAPLVISSSLSWFRPPPPPSKFHPPPDPPPHTSPYVPPEPPFETLSPSEPLLETLSPSEPPLEALSPPESPPETLSPPEPPDPPDAPFSLVFLLLFDTSCAFSQPVSKAPDLESCLLNMAFVFCDEVASLVYVGDTSFVSKYWYPAVCSVVLCWCDFIHSTLPLSMIVIVSVDSTMGWSIPITISVSLPRPFIYYAVSLLQYAVPSLWYSSPFSCGSVMLKIRDTSNTEVLIKGFVAMLKIVDCAIVDASILRIISLIVVSNFQGVVSLYSSMVVEIRGLLDVISCLSVLSGMLDYWNSMLIKRIYR